MRVGGSNLRMRFPGAALGVPVGPARLVTLCGLAAAKYLLLSSRTVGADEALRLGLVNRVAPAAGDRGRGAGARRRGRRPPARGGRPAEADAARVGRRRRPLRGRGRRPGRVAAPARACRSRTNPGLRLLGPTLRARLPDERSVRAPDAEVSCAPPVRRSSGTAGRPPHRGTGSGCACSGGRLPARCSFHAGALWRLNELGYLPRLDPRLQRLRRLDHRGVLGAALGATLGFGRDGVAPNFDARSLGAAERAGRQEARRPGGAAPASLLPGTDRRPRSPPPTGGTSSATRTLQDAASHAGPRFVINATNLAVGCRSGASPSPYDGRLPGRA